MRIKKRSELGFYFPSSKSEQTRSRRLSFLSEPNGEYMNIKANEYEARKTFSNKKFKFKSKIIL